MTISTFTAIKEAASDGKIFSVIFVKKDGTLRSMVARTGVKKHLKSNPVTDFFSVKVRKQDDNLITVFDMNKKEYRSFHQNTVLAVKMKGETFSVLSTNA